MGRGQLVEELLRILEPGGPRAVVVAGLAGVGKSALVVTVAQRALKRRRRQPACDPRRGGTDEETAGALQATVGIRSSPFSDSPQPLLPHHHVGHGLQVWR
ncbi:ATP-binding protein [Streptomyces massasporeus]